jgi:hypothetical protein
MRARRGPSHHSNVLFLEANRAATIELFTEKFGPSVCVADAHVIYTLPWAVPASEGSLDEQAVGALGEKYRSEMDIGSIPVLV